MYSLQIFGNKVLIRGKKAPTCVDEVVGCGNKVVEPNVSWPQGY